MNRFGELLLEARTEARLTQEVLAKKVDVHNTYVSKLEKGVESPPSRRVTVKLADALGMSHEQVTLYVSTKDRDALERFIFLLEAKVAGSEDVQEIRLVEVEEDKGEKAQANPTPLHGVAHAAKTKSRVPLVTIGEEIDLLIATAPLTEEEEEKVSAALIEITKQILGIVQAQPEKSEAE